MITTFLGFFFFVVAFNQDNAMSFTAPKTVERISQFGYEQLLHPPYCLDQRSSVSKQCFKATREEEQCKQMPKKQIQRFLCRINKKKKLFSPIGTMRLKQWRLY